MQDGRAHRIFRDAQAVGAPVLRQIFKSARNFVQRPDAYPGAFCVLRKLLLAIAKDLAVRQPNSSTQRLWHVRHRQGS
jgi:hypothetical protein